MITNEEKEKTPESNWYEIDLDKIAKTKDEPDIEVNEEEEKKDDDNKSDAAKANLKSAGNEEKTETEKENKEQTAEVREEDKERPNASKRLRNEVAFNRGGRAEKRIRELWQQKTLAEQRADAAEARLLQRERNVRTQDVGRIAEKVETIKKLVAQAELAYEKAEAEGDIKAKLQAQKALFDAQIDLKVAEATKAHVTAQTEEEDENIEAANRLNEHRGKTPPNPFATEWAARNPWFGKDREASAIAFSLDQVLASEGNLTPDTEEYWDELDKRLKKRGIAVTEVDRDTDDEDLSEDKAKSVQSPVGGGSGKGNLKRAGNAAIANVSEGEIKKVGNKTIVRLTREELSMAKRLGVSPERFAKQKVNINKEGKETAGGWTEIDLG